MKLLLDTHIWLWSRLTGGRLSQRTAAMLTNADNELWLSPISTWEVAGLVRKKRLVLQGGWHAWAREAWNTGGYREAAVTNHVVLASDSISLRHRDPFDWLLAATARSYGLALVTADAQLLAGAGFETIAGA